MSEFCATILGDTRVIKIDGKMMAGKKCGPQHAKSHGMSVYHAAQQLAGRVYGRARMNNIHTWDQLSDKIFRGYYQGRSGCAYALSLCEDGEMKGTMWHW